MWVEGSSCRNGKKMEVLEVLLSRIVVDPTVGSRWDEKESCSTRRGLLVGTRFKEFSQTP